MLKDIQGYISLEGGDRTLVLRSEDDSIECKCRFSKIAPQIPFSYDNLVNALYEAIDKEAKDNGGKFVTDKREAVIDGPTYDYDALIDEFESIVGDLMNKNQVYYAPRVTSIVDKYLGKGKKVSDTTIEQAEFIDLIVSEIKDTLVK